MIFRKNNIDNNHFELDIINENNEILEINYCGCDLYWTCLNYTENNEFVIKESDGVFFRYLNDIFNIIEENDNIHEKTLNENRFEWISEAYGEKEFAHKLIIEKNDDNFKIKFFQNSLNWMCIKEMCPVCFCLSGSRNQTIASAFSLVFLKYMNSDNDFSLKRNLE